jgi:hypothetical protein
MLDVDSDVHGLLRWVEERKDGNGRQVILMV